MLHINYESGYMLYFSGGQRDTQKTEKLLQRVE